MESLHADSNITLPRLIVVDDESHIRAGLVKALSIMGYFVEEAASGVEALMLLEQTKFDLMVLDMVMPNMDGEDILQRVSILQPDLLIIVLTGNPTIDNAIAAIKSGVVDYLRKPTSIHDIVDAVAKALQKRTVQAQKNYLLDELGHMLEKEDAATLHSPQLVRDTLARFLFVHPIKLDRSKQMVTYVDDSSLIVTLSKGETAVLACLMSNSNQALSCQQLVHLAWGYETDQSDAESVIRPYISRLRRKIESDPQKPLLVRTIRRQGYQFVSKPNKDSLQNGYKHSN